MDLCGNAFAATCLQAKLLVSLVRSTGWDTLTPSKPRCAEVRESTKRGRVASLGFARRLRRKTRDASFTAGSLSQLSCYLSWFAGRKTFDCVFSKRSHCCCAKPYSPKPLLERSGLRDQGLGLEIFPLGFRAWGAFWRDSSGALQFKEI